MTHRIQSLRRVPFKHFMDNKIKRTGMFKITA
jgi:hypothetical protein